MLDARQTKLLMAKVMVWPCQPLLEAFRSSYPSPLSSTTLLHVIIVAKFWVAWNSWLIVNTVVNKMTPYKLKRTPEIKHRASSYILFGIIQRGNEDESVHKR